MIRQKLAGELVGATVRSADGEKLGKIGHIFLDDHSGRLEWVSVHTGLFGPRESFLPLAQIRLDGTDARVPYHKQTVIGAPNVDIDGWPLSQRDEAELYRYYGLTYGGAPEQGAARRGAGGRGPSLGRGRLRQYFVAERPVEAR